MKVQKPLKGSRPPHMERVYVKVNSDFDATGYRQIIWICVPQTDGQADLRVCIDEQDALACAGKPDAKVCSCGRFANAAFLVGDGENSCGHKVTSVLI